MGNDEVVAQAYGVVPSGSLGLLLGGVVNLKAGRLKENEILHCIAKDVAYALDSTCLWEAEEYDS